ncbi:MAG: hypothetical protein ACK47R_07070, partial [Planctomycetia bacterium]
MKKINRRSALKASAVTLASLPILGGATVGQQPSKPFGADFPNLESLTTGKWWAQLDAPKNQTKAKGKGGGSPAPSMDVARDKVIAFALYTHHRGVLKLSAQLFPLKPEEDRAVRLEILQEGKWHEVARADVFYPGWDVHFRVEKWDNSRDSAYR